MSLFGKRPSAPVVTAEAQIVVGQPATLEGASPSQPFAAVFEDDGDTGYFYVLDRRLAEQPIIDALQIYRVSAVGDRGHPTRVRIVWAEKGMSVALFINDQAHAIVSFDKRRASCRLDFPPANGSFTSSHAWDDSLLEPFR